MGQWSEKHRVIERHQHLHFSDMPLSGKLQTAFQAGASNQLGNFACHLACLDNLDRATECVVKSAEPWVPQIFQAYLSRRIKARQYLPYRIPCSYLE